ncbi:cysteine dioxygenase [Altibacter sp. HG106]|uniref:cysteine dioxygenase n=1 Tax=Altibacter sp. HG106 TaxID=3023937 RepID=UPI002350B2E1|nr:cysteine dioxygenase family protein [Altibacter sp. HG106]MDC7995342.1 cysteine dioxygenase family protein [Altibacter sp. HG106]
MTPITSVDQLIECFEEAAPSEQVRILKRMQIPIEEFEAFASWESGTYTRNCVTRSEHFEFILLCWDQGAQTGIHDHSGQNCWVCQLQGSLAEVRYEEKDGNLTPSAESSLAPGTISFMDDSMGYHTLENPTQQRAMTLHVYVNPIDSCRIYNEEKACFETSEMEYHTEPVQNAQAS